MCCIKNYSARRLNDSLYNHMHVLLQETYLDDCKFQEVRLDNTYYAFYSLKYEGTRRQPKRKWYIGISPDGEMRAGQRTRQKQAFAQFLTMPSSGHFHTDETLSEQSKAIFRNRTSASPPLGRGRVGAPVTPPKRRRRPPKFRGSKDFKDRRRPHKKKRRRGKQKKTKRHKKRRKMSKAKGVTPMPVQCGQSGILSTCEIHQLESKTKKRRRKSRRGKRRDKNRGKNRRKSANLFKTKAKGDGPRGKTGVPLLS